MSEPEVALVFSPERWVEDLHRYCVDHGGARIRCIVMDPGIALDEDYGVLVVSHRWPGLTVGFVEAVHARGRRVLGVVDPAEPTATRHLELVSVDRIVRADATPGELVAAIVDLAPDATARVAAGRPPGDDRDAASVRARGPIVVGGPAGAGRTELAIELAHAFSRGGRSSVLVDADDVAPAVATRLGLPIEPNLRTAIDAVEYGLGALSDALTGVAGSGADFRVLGGLPNVGSWSQLRTAEVLDVVTMLGSAYDRVVVDIASALEDVASGGRGRFAVGRALVEQADLLVGVGAGTPVGVVRLLAWAVDARTLNPVAPLHLVVSRAPGDRFRRGEIVDEVTRTFPASSLTFVPADRRVEDASWEGELVAAGPFVKAVAALAVVLGSNASRSSTRSGRRRAPTRRRAPGRIERAVA